MKFSTLDLEQVLLEDAKRIQQSRNEGRLLHNTTDIDASGDEVEMSVRSVLEKWLPKSCYIGHGHIVDCKANSSPQLDVIVAEKEKMQVLFSAKNGTEYFPYENVYTIGEIKTTYRDNERYIQKFSETIREIRGKMTREPVFPKEPDQRMFVNPLYSFMFFVDSGNFDVKQIVDFFEKTENTFLPNFICFLDRGIILNSNVKMQKRELGDINFDLTYEQFCQNAWSFVPFGKKDCSMASCLAFVIYMLSTQIQFTTLSRPNMLEYFRNLFSFPKTQTFALKNN